MESTQYPASPALGNYDFIQPSPAFKKAARAVVWSIVFFFCVYIVLMAISASILVGSFYAGISIIVLRPSILTIALGGGLIILGIMFFIFFIKFLFSRTKDENPQRVQIHERDYPQLFAFIRQLTIDTKTKFPKKVYVSPDVNASVFYNSSFWSLFFPVRKNLEIGLGLVNTLNISELKSVLAHEFGHFSQRSMKIGSYIYTVNKALFDMVFEYDNWDLFLAQGANMGGVLGFFASITIRMVNMVRSLLKVAYKILNLNYLKLSRQMEYHADLVAVSVSGNRPFKDALRRLEFASEAYASTTHVLDELANHKKASTNLYQNHTFMMRLLAEDNHLNFNNGQWVITDEDIERVSVRSRLNIKDQWASHPSATEREQNIATVNITANYNQASAWQLCTNGDKLQASMTTHLYQLGYSNDKLEGLPAHEFEAYVHTDNNKYRLSDAYNGYYNGRKYTALNIDELLAQPIPVPTITFNELYSTKRVGAIKWLGINIGDLDALNQIKHKQLPNKQFEYDGKKYRQHHAAGLVSKLNEEIEQQANNIADMDREAFLYNYHMATQAGQQQHLADLYRHMYAHLQDFAAMEHILDRAQALTNKLYSQPSWEEAPFRIMLSEFSDLEKSFRTFLNDLNQPNNPLVLDDPVAKKSLHNYIDGAWFFSRATDFDEQAYLNFNQLMSSVFQALGNAYSRQLKILTDFQLTLQPANA